MHWDERKKRDKAKQEKRNVVPLQLEAYQRKGAFPEGLDERGKLDFVLDFIRSKRWASKHVQSYRRNTMQGGYTVLSQHEDEGFVSVMGHSIGLSLVALEFNRQTGACGLVFESPEEAVGTYLEVCVVRISDRFEVKKDWIDSLDVGESTYQIASTEHEDELSVLIGQHVVAAWSEIVGGAPLFHVLWSYGHILTLNFSPKMTEAVVGKDFGFFKDSLPRSLSVVVGKS